MQILIKRLTVVFIISILTYGIFKRALDNNILSTIYSVSGILFSVGMGLIITFNLNDIKNKEYISSIRKRINHIRDTYIEFFALLTFSYLLNFIIPNFGFNINLPANFNISFYVDINNFIQYFTLIFCLFTLFYFTINFKGVQKLKDEICDRLHSR